MRVFYTSPWVPAEWVRAHGLEAHGVWWDPDFAWGSLPLGAGVCAFAEAAVRLAESRPDAAVIFTTHCDQLRRGFDLVASSLPHRLFLFNLPATWHTAAAERIFASELDRLGKFLQALGGRPPAAEDLREIITQHRNARERLLKAGPACAARPYAEAMARFHWDGSASLPEERPRSESTPKSDEAGSRPGRDDDPALLALVGGPLPRSQWGLLEAIERAGGRVVLNATEAGERSLWVRSAEGVLAGTVADLRDRLARDYLQNCVDVSQRPNTPLYTWLQARLAARHVRGIILWHYVGCDLWRAEAHSLKEAFGLPLLALDADEVASGNLRNLGRVEAFVEALR